MEAIKQIMRVTKDHKIRARIPSYIPENEIVEMILIVKKKPNSFYQKIKELKGIAKDNLFLSDLIDISEDFEIVDFRVAE